MAATHYYVDANIVTGNHDGSSWANAYASLSLAEAGLQKDLDTADEQMTIHCRGTAGTPDVSAVLVDGWITSAADNLVIQVDLTDRGSAVWDTSHYHLQVSDTHCLQVNEDYVWIDGLQIATVSPAGSDRGCFTIGNLTNGANQIYVTNCIMKGHKHASYTQSVFKIGGDYVNLTAWNVLVYNLGVTASTCFLLMSGGTVSQNLYNCVAISGNYGFYRGSGTVTLKNCYGGGTATGDYEGTIPKTTCASEDATGSVGLTGIAVSTDNFVNVSEGTEDFRLPLGSALIDVGTDLSATFTVDIVGTTRPTGVNTWDIGIYEFVAAGGSLIPAIMDFYRRRRA